MTHFSPGFIIPPSYAITNSCSFDGSAEYMSLTPGAGPDSTTIRTFSAWYKRSSAAADRDVLFCASDGAGNLGEILEINASNKWYDNIFNYPSPGEVMQYITTATYTDTASWHHIHATRSGTTEVLTFDGTVVSAFDTSTAPGASDPGYFGTSGYVHRIGSITWAARQYFAGLLADVIYLDGVAEPASSFITGAGGSPKDPSGLTFGTRGFWLDFKDNGNSGINLGFDAANSNDFTPTAMAAGNQSTDVPT